MAKVTEVKRGASSVDAQQSEEMDYRREQGGEGDEAYLDSIQIKQAGSGWELVVTHDRNGRKEKQSHRFDTFKEAWQACEPDEGEQEEEKGAPEPLRQPGPRYS
jgi:hypothetical protein